MTDADLLEGVVSDSNAILDYEDFSPLPPLVFEGVKDDSGEEPEVDEGIRSKEIAALLDDANDQVGFQGVDSGNDIPPLATVE